MTKTAYLAGGCFWCITPAFRETEGVLSVVSGYCGGSEAAPTYADVKAQRTGHRETIAVTYDPERIGFGALLALFLDSVDPFDGGGQFIDRGRSYTLAVYYTDEAQRGQAKAALAALRERSGREPRVSLEPFMAFWEAEEYHQDWDLKHPEAFEEELISSGRKPPKEAR